MGKVNITNVPQILCRISGVLTVVSVMALVANMPAPNRAAPISASQVRPILPLLVVHAGQMAKSKEKTLHPQQKNANRIIQPCVPISYSLIMRHEGASSGFMICNKNRMIRKAEENNIVKFALVNAGQFSVGCMINVFIGVRGSALLGQPLTLRSSYFALLGLRPRRLRGSRVVGRLGLCAVGWDFIGDSPTGWSSRRQCRAQGRCGLNRQAG